MKPPKRDRIRPGFAGSGSVRRSASQRSGGTSVMPSRPSASRSQKPSGEVTPPGNRQPMPMIATGSRAADSAWASRARMVSTACNARLTGDSSEEAGSRDVSLDMLAKPFIDRVPPPSGLRTQSPRASSFPSNNASASSSDIRATSISASGRVATGAGAAAVGAKPPP